MSKQVTNHSGSKGNESQNVTQSKQGPQPENPQESKKNWLKATTDVLISAARTTTHVIGYAYIPAQSKWFAHGATELANMILHGHPAPVYDSGSVFGSPKDSEAQPPQVSTMPQPKADQQTKQQIAVEPATELKSEESLSPSPKAEAKVEIAPPNVPMASPESSVEQRMQEILEMEAAPSMQQQQQMSH